MKLALKIAVSAGVLAALVLLLPWEDLGSAARRIRPGVWLGVFAGYLIGHALGVVKWRSILAAGRAELSGGEAVRCYSAGLFANLWLPTIVGGDVWRATLAGRATGRPEAVVIGGIGDRVSDMLALTAIAFGGALFARSSLPPWAGNALTVLTVGAIFGFAVLLPLAFRRPLARWPRRSRRSVGRTLVAIRRLIRTPSIAVAVFALSLAIQSGFVLLNAWLGSTIGIDVPLAGWFVVWPLAKAVSMLPVSVGGLGVRETALGAGLASFGARMAQGVVVSLAWVSVHLVGGLAAGAIWLLLQMRAPAGPGRAARGTPSPVANRNG